MMFDLVEVNDVMFSTSNINLVLVIMNFLFHLGEQEDQQGEQG
jgi:hypothetical protein